jgi:hypothetical protein
VLCGTGGDVLRWLRFQLSGGLLPDGTRLVDAAALRETHTPQVVEPALGEEGTRLYPETVQRSYAMGWSVFDYRGHRILTHAGAQNGFRLRSTFAPDAGVGVYVVANSVTFLPEVVRNGVLDLLFGLPPKDWLGLYNGLQESGEARAAKTKVDRAAKRHKRTRPSRPGAAYAGVYDEPAYGPAAVTAEGDTLRLAWSGFTATLKHWHFDAFRAESGDDTFDGTEVHFTLDRDGTPTTLAMVGATFRRTG